MLTKYCIQSHCKLLQASRGGSSKDEPSIRYFNLSTGDLVIYHLHKNPAQFIIHKGSLFGDSAWSEMTEEMTNYTKTEIKYHTSTLQKYSND